GVLAGHEVPSEQDRQLVELIEESTEHLNRLVHRLLDLSTLERSLPSLAIEPVDVARGIDQAPGTSSVPCVHSVSLYVPPDVEVLAEELSLEQILVNLLRNAYSYGGGEIHIEVEAADGRVRLSVTDNGPGVDPAIEDRLFESFVRGTDQRVAGAGLGLPISRGLAEAMGGSMHYERADEGGSRFTVELPAPS